MVLVGGGGGLLKEPLRRVFDMLRYFKLILSSAHSLWSTNSLKKMRYILWVMALLEACDVTNNGRNLGCDLGFYQELEIRWKLRSMEILVCWTCKKHINKHHFIRKLYFYCWKKLKNMDFHSKMAWTPATYDVISRNHRNRSHLTCLKMCARDKRTATENVRNWCFIV